MPREWKVAGPAAPLTTLAALRQHLLARQGLTVQDEARFFSPLYERDIFDPLSLEGTEAAVDRIYAAVQKKERILVWGDYDADGISSTAILVSTFEELGLAVVPFLPHREEQGYGLNQKALEGLVAEIDLVVTCDCGVANAAEITWLAEQGIDTLVFDHHTLPAELPAAWAVVHPQHPKGAYAGGALCGAGVSWKVASALLRDPRSPHHQDIDREKWLLDLAVLGTVADMVPLRGENRTIVQFGLEVLRRTRRPGLEAFLSLLKLERSALSADDIAFKIAPRLNAAGRMDHAQPALDLLLTQSSGHALELAMRLEYLNRQRQAVTTRMLREAESLVGSGPIIFAYSANWRAGVVGLAAGRLADKYGRPAVVIGTNGRHAVGSARSPSGVNILQVLETGRHHLLALGGHAQAAGFSLTPAMVPEFREVLLQGATNLPEEGSTSLPVDAVVDKQLLTAETLHLLDTFAPFGEGNPQPRLLVKGLSLSHWRTVGKSGKHVKFEWDINGEMVDGIGFGLASKVAGLPQGATVDVVGALEANEWRGRRSLQLEVEDVAPSGTVRVVSSKQ